MPIKQLLKSSRLQSMPTLLPALIAMQAPAVFVTDAVKPKSSKVLYQAPTEILKKFAVVLVDLIIETCLPKPLFLMCLSAFMVSSVEILYVPGSQITVAPTGRAANIVVQAAVLS